MIHDPALLDRLEALPQEPFDALVYRVTRLGLDPQFGTHAGGRWMARDGAATLYCSLEPEGALAELVFLWSQLMPRPLKQVLVHRMHVQAPRVLRVSRADLRSLGVSDAELRGVHVARTRAVGAAAEFLGCQGLVSASVRWPCDNLILFPARMGPGSRIDMVGGEVVDWMAWGTSAGLIGTE